MEVRRDWLGKLWEIDKIIISTHIIHSQSNLVTSVLRIITIDNFEADLGTPRPC